MSAWKIESSELADIDFICQLFDEAIAYQKRKGYPEYRWNDREAQAGHIKDGKHFKVTMDKEIAAIFNVQETDKNIWRHRDRGDAFYVHGVVVNQKFKGKKLFGKILAWLTEHAKHHGKSSIRLDTWSNNPDLIDYYERFGFVEIEVFQIPNAEEVALNCRGNEVVLMEYPLR